MINHKFTSFSVTFQIIICISDNSNSVPLFLQIQTEIEKEEKKNNVPLSLETEKNRKVSKESSLCH